MIIPLKVYNRYPNKNLDELTEVCFDIEEKIIFELVEELIDIIKNPTSLEDIKEQIIKYDKIIQETNSWNRIKIRIFNKGYRPGRISKLNLLEFILDQEKVKETIDSKISKLVARETE
jgi:hypothetical protein